jgi:hypothetical protein
VTRDRVGRPLAADSVSVSEVVPTADVKFDRVVVLVVAVDVVDDVAGGLWCE